MNEEDIRNIMLNAISGYDKTRGTWIWDIFSAVAIVNRQIWDTVNKYISKYDPANLSGAELDEYVKSWVGISRKAGEYASGIVTLIGNGTVPAGVRVVNTSNNIYYTILETVDVNGSADVAVQCEIIGADGNCDAGKIDKIMVSAGNITAITNTEAIVNGADEESDESLLSRYYDAMAPYGSGNKQHYVNWAKEVAGVGNVKVERAANGAGTVKVIIIKEDGTNADDELVSKVQEYLDPLDSQGQGNGMAPIGAVVTVTKADDCNVSIKCNISTSGEYDAATVLYNIKEAVMGYVGTLGFRENELSLGRVYQIILNTDGVTDCEDLMLNDGYKSIKCSENEVFKIDFEEVEVS